MSEHTIVKCIEGKQLYLRPVDPRTDAERYYRWMNDPEVTRWLLHQPPMPYPAEIAYLEHATKERPTTDYVFAIVLAADDAHIGSVGIHRIDWISRTGGTGLMIGAREHWRKGYGFAAKMLALRFAFQTLGLRKVISGAIAGNTASRGNLEKQGYREIGRRRAHIFRHGTFHDEILFELFAEEFAAVWERHRSAVLPDDLP